MAGAGPRATGLYPGGRAKVELEVPKVLVIPPVLLKTDLLTLIPWHFGPQFEALYGVKTYKLLPLKISDRINLISHRSYENDPELRWFRDIEITAMQMR